MGNRLTGQIGIHRRFYDGRAGMRGRDRFPFDEQKANHKPNIV